MSKTAKGIIVLLMAAIFMLIVQRSCDVPTPEPRDRTEELMAEILDLKGKIGGRDSIIDRSHDTVVYRVGVVRETVREYWTVHDTIEKLRICDSLAIQAGKLADECERNDSLHLAQEGDMRLVIAKQDTVIEIQGVDIEQKKRALCRWKVGAAGLGAAVLALIITR